MDMQTEIKKEMALLQKKMLMESVSQHYVAFERERKRGSERGREREREKEREREREIHVL